MYLIKNFSQSLPVESVEQLLISLSSFKGKSLSVRATTPSGMHKHAFVDVDDNGCIYPTYLDRRMLKAEDFTLNGYAFS